MNGSGNSVERTSATTKVVFTFGRFQPPTLGHQVLIDEVIHQAGDNDADAYVFVSAKQNDHVKYLKSKAYLAMIEKGEFVSIDANENPLSPFTKVALLQKQHEDKSVKFINTEVCNCRNVFAIVDVLRSAGYTDLTMIVGSDRVPVFQGMFGGGNKGEGSLTPVHVVAAGEARNISANAAAAAGGGAAGEAQQVIPLKAMSGTKMRKAAVAGDLATLAGGIKFGSVTDDDVKRVANEIRTALGYSALKGGTRRKRKSTRRRR